MFSHRRKAWFISIFTKSKVLINGGNTGASEAETEAVNQFWNWSSSFKNEHCSSLYCSPTNSTNIPCCQGDTVAELSKTL